LASAPRRAILDVMRELPSGTVTFLFTDIEGSTRLLHELGDAYAEALAEHRRVLREAFARHGGVEVDTQGDAFFVAFPRATDALEAARDGQAALAGGSIRVRMGIHTGEPLATDEGYVGIDVHRAARIASAGHGGQVLVSQSTRDLSADDGLRELGEHRLKDLAEPERLYQLGGREFPALKTLYQTNLPIPATPFLGRERELEEVQELISRPDVRLLTLSGPGGTGKTRLALQAAAEAAERFPDGIYWVPLASLRDASLVLDVAARALGAADGLVERIADKSLLLLFDNFEHLIEAAPELSSVLAACPKLRLIVTSRELLRVPGEQAYPVPPLDPKDGEELFVALARASKPDFRTDEPVKDLCAKLENLPLALELAAARVRVLSPDELLQRLSKRLDLLKGGRGVDARQQTLRATIEWSHDLLDGDEQRLFARLAVFRGGCTIQAAEQVCDADIDTLQSLVDKSLVRVREGDRFWMLETIREFAAERLDESGEADAIRRRHADAILALVESADLTVEAHAAGLRSRQELVVPEQANIRAALDWLVGADEIELALQLAVALENYWVTTSPAEGTRSLTELLERGEDIPAELRVRAIRALAGAIYIGGDFETGTRYVEQGLAEYRRLGDDWGVAHMLQRLALEAQRADDPERARSLLEQSLSLDDSAFNEVGALRVLGDLAFAEGRAEESIELLDRCAARAKEINWDWWQLNALAGAAEYMLMLGRPDEALPRVRDALVTARTLHDRQGLAYCLGLIAWVAAARGQAERAGTLWGAVEAEAERGRIGQWENERDEYAGHVFAAAGPEFERARADGRAMTSDEVVEYALSLD
jgi:predicted ATPase/class 3 adenylate cyclase